MNDAVENIKFKVESQMLNVRKMNVLHFMFDISQEGGSYEQYHHSITGYRSRPYH